MAKQTKLPKIVLVDDESTARLLLSKMIPKSHYDLTVLGNSEDCLYEAPKTKPDLIIVDIIMPDIDGYELCQKLRKDQRTKNTPIIIISSLPKHTQLEEVKSAGAVAYLEKPVDEKTLLLAIESALRGLKSRL